MIASQNEIAELRKDYDIYTINYLDASGNKDQIEEEIKKLDQYRKT